jgi:hypothetical protein
MQWKILIFIIILESVFNVSKNKDKYYFCNSKVFDPDVILTSTEINKLCSKLFKYNNILIGVQKKLTITYTVTKEEEDRLYTRDTEDLFLTQCDKVGGSTCKQGVLFSIYTEIRKAKLTTGPNTSIRMYTSRLLQRVAPMLTTNRIYDAMDIMIDSIDEYKPVKVEEESSSMGFLVFIIYLFIIGFCAFTLYVIYQSYKKQKREEFRESVKDSSTIYKHLHKLNHLLAKIKKNSPPIVSSKKCLICMKKMNFNNSYMYEMNNFTTQPDMRTNLIQNDNLLNT